MTTVAEFLARKLRKIGVRRVYGLPGGENVEVLDAIRRQGIEFILVRNESSACFTAATEARLTGIPGVALTTLGPGATNATVGLAHAHLDRAPVILITAASDSALLGRHTHQLVDLSALFAPISKMTTELSEANAVDTINLAIEVAAAGRPGPVHLSIHNNVALHSLAAEPITAGEIAAIEPVVLSQPQFSDLLRDKNRPIIVIGLGLEPEGPYTQLRQFAEALDAPVIDTPKSKGALSADHPLFAGTIGLTATDPVYELLDEADCIIAIGFEVVELVKPWDQSQPLIWVSNWENTDPGIACEFEYVGPIGDMLDELAGVDIQRADDWGASRVSVFRRQQTRLSLPAAKPGTILPRQLLRVLRDLAPDDVIITTDVGSHKIFTALNWPARQPNRYFVSNGLSAMGFGLTSAIAAALITGQSTVCITGDAGLAMVIGELGLLQELSLPVIVMVMNDSALDLIRSAQHRRQRPAYGTEFTNPDFALIADAYGLDYRRVESEADCASALRHWLEGDMPLIADVMIDTSGYSTTVRHA